jgi:CMP-N-acetylneuraminic acid synthetase
MTLGIFVPGRLQSQRLPEKLILPLGDTCLWEIALKKINDLPNKYEKVALCNDWELLDIATKFKNIQIIVRDDSTKVDGDLNFIYKDVGKMHSNHIMFFNPCLPMIKRRTIVKALEYYENNNCNYLESVKPFKNWVFDENGKAVNHIDYKRMSTKEVKTWYLDANAFRIFNKNFFLEDGYMLKKGHAIFSISELESIDVDTEEDYAIAKAILGGIK